MKKILLALALVSGVAVAADERVDGYMKHDGTYVQPYHRTTPDNRLDNNYGTQGNYNPYTGQQGTRNPNPEPRLDNPYAEPRQRRNNSSF